MAELRIEVKLPPELAAKLDRLTAALKEVGDAWEDLPETARLAIGGVAISLGTTLDEGEE